MPVASTKKKLTAHNQPIGLQATKSIHAYLEVWSTTTSKKQKHTINKIVDEKFRLPTEISSEGAQLWCIQEGALCAIKNWTLGLVKTLVSQPFAKLILKFVRLMFKYFQLDDNLLCALVS